MNVKDRYIFTHCDHCMGELEISRDKIKQIDPIIKYILICYECRIKYNYYKNPRTGLHTVFEETVNYHTSKFI